ncbi:hypothetical protein EYF80_023950 [Liparis tanakae]|uniref:Uncharacterized protein n=1 Tax=Liparis tanakae TaxID=230148 RepID=A0A4Z2HJ12_9TELE|nr:hypothetical protein EYF80_023950 [Liparis tanakae]
MMRLVECFFAWLTSDGLVAKHKWPVPHDGRNVNCNRGETRRPAWRCIKVRLPQTPEGKVFSSTCAHLAITDPEVNFLFNVCPAHIRDVAPMKTYTFDYPFVVIVVSDGPITDPRKHLDFTP